MYGCVSVYHCVYVYVRVSLCMWKYRMLCVQGCVSIGRLQCKMWWLDLERHFVGKAEADASGFRCNLPLELDKHIVRCVSV